MAERAENGHPGLIAYEGLAPRVAADAFIAPNATLIGDIEVGDLASIWYGCVLRADVNSIRIGPRTNLQDGTIVHVSPGSFPTRIGADVLVGHQALLHGCTLEDEAYIGIRATVLNGCVIEGGAIVAAGALVVEGTRVPSGELWAGTPARRLRDLREGEAQAMQEAVRHYIVLAGKHRRAGPAAPKKSGTPADGRRR